MNESQLVLRPLMTLKIKLASTLFPREAGQEDGPVRVGKGPYGLRKVFSAESGRFDFDPASDLGGYSGEIVPGPADYCLKSSSGNCLTVDVRALLKVKAPYEFAIYMHYCNCVEFSDKLAETIYSSGLELSESNFITQPRFEVGDSGDGLKLRPEVMRLNTMATVAHAALRRMQVDYEVYQIVNSNF